MRRRTASMLVLAALLPAQQPPAVAKVLGLFQALTAAQSGAKTHLAFTLNDAELNEYLSYSLRVNPRPGVQSAVVKVFRYNYISTYAVLDFDAVERSRPGTIPAWLRPVLSGRQAILADCRFRANGGVGVFHVEKAYYGKLRLPAFVVQKVIESIAARQPEHYDLTKPAPLPFGLRNLWTGDGMLMGEN